MISLKDFYDYKYDVEEFITNKAFRSRMMFEAIFDEKFAKEISDYIKTFNTCEVSSLELNSIFEELLEKTGEYYKLTQSEVDINQKLNNALRALAYFYFMESVDEHSLYSNNVIAKIKEKHPNDYLQIISEIDKTFLSADTKDKITSQQHGITIEEDLLKQYIVLKEWQDKQRAYFINGFGKFIEEVQYEYYGDRSLNSFDLEHSTLRKRLFSGLSEKKILDLDTVSIIAGLYIKKYVIQFIGGKMYGLAILNSKGIKVPFSMVIPTNVEVLPEDLEIFKNKYERYSIRSSADIEDGEKNSFAGMFDSYLDVSYENITENIKKVKDSVNNERLKKYIAVNNLDNPHMAVIIQSFKEPTYAGVWVGNSYTDGILEWVEGNGEKLVSGSITPHTEIWKNARSSANTLKIAGFPIGNKLLNYQEKIGSNADFEWMILDNELVMLQFRPVTQKVTINDNYTINENNNISGIPASPGNVTGYARFVESPSEEIIKDRILLARMTDPDWLPHLLNSNGATTAYGGFLCHTAIICRELSIPCVTGIGEDSLEKLTKDENTYINVDGNRGYVTILKKIDNEEVN